MGWFHFRSADRAGSTAARGSVRWARGGHSLLRCPGVQQARYGQKRFASTPWHIGHLDLLRKASSCANRPSFQCLTCQTLVLTSFPSSVDDVHITAALACVPQPTLCAKRASGTWSGGASGMPRRRSWRPSAAKRSLRRCAARQPLRLRCAVAPHVHETLRGTTLFPMFPMHGCVVCLQVAFEFIGWRCRVQHVDVHQRTDIHGDCLRTPTCLCRPPAELELAIEHGPWRTAYATR